MLRQAESTTRYTYLPNVNIFQPVLDDNDENELNRYDSFSFNANINNQINGLYRPPIGVYNREQDEWYASVPRPGINENNINGLFKPPDNVNNRDKQISKCNDDNELNKCDPSPFNVNIDNDNDISVSFSPALDIYDREKQVELYVSIPGIDEKNINVEFDSKLNQLTISGEIESSLTKENKKDLISKERNSGKFIRIVKLYYIKIDEENIKKKYNNGVLELIIAKKVETNTPNLKRKLSIQNLILWLIMNSELKKEEWIV